jgi:hypothetical protein
LGWDNAGNYNRQHNFSADASAGIKILAQRMDAEFDDFASAMTLAVTRNGQNAPTANLPMGGFRHVGVGAPLSATNYIRAKDFIENVPIYMVDAEASADRISVSASFYTTASAGAAPRDGSQILVKAGSDKSSAVAIRLNTGDGSPHSAAVILANGSALYSGAIRSGGIYEFLWSSSDTAWQLFNPQVDYATSAYPGVALLATAAEVAAGTDVPKIVTPAQLASKFSASYATVTSAGFVELATTAEVAAGTNISAAITPSTLHSYASAATTASAGLLEIATTAEATVGSDTSKAITPSTLRAVRDTIETYAAAFAVAGSGTALSKSRLASAWTLASAGFAHYRLNHFLGLTSAHELVISIQLWNLASVDRYTINGVSADLSGFSFNIGRASVSATTLSATPSSCNIHILAQRIF